MLVASIFTPPAEGRGLNSRSDNAALHAYNRYLRSLIARSTVGSHRDEVFLDQVRSGCLGYLSPFASQISSSAGTDFGVEIGADIAIRFTSVNGKPLRRLAATLVKLRWANRATSKTVDGFISAERRLVHLRVSKLCVDAIQLGFHPTEVSARTTRFDARFTRVTAAAAQGLSDFVTILERYEPSGDAQLIARIDQHSTAYETLASSIEGPDQAALIQDLGLQGLS